MPADPSLNYLVRPLQQSLRDRQPERLRRLKVDDQLELGGLLDGQIRRLRPLENLVHVARGAPILLKLVRPVRDKTVCLDKILQTIHCWQPMSSDEFYYSSPVAHGDGILEDHHSVRLPLNNCLKRAL